MSEAPGSLRIDKWLWYARFFKTRSLASKIVAGGAVRVNGTHIRKSSTLVGVGDTLTFAQAKDVRVIRVVALGERRGPATEAQGLYEDLSPPSKEPRNVPQRHPDAAQTGRPTKKLRRDLDAFKRTS